MKVDLSYEELALIKAGLVVFGSPAEMALFRRLEEIDRADDGPEIAILGASRGNRAGRQ